MLDHLDVSGRFAIIKLATGALRAVHVGARVLIPDVELRRASRFGVGKPRTTRGQRTFSRR
jgi:hypothetical protein